MIISQKSQYALRAVFELAKRSHEKNKVKIADIARSQAIPPRFLEIILVQLKQTGIVESRRGKDGGYRLLRAPGDLTVGEVIRFIQGTYDPVPYTANQSDTNGSPDENSVFSPVWEEARSAVSKVYETTTFQDLIDKESMIYQETSFCYTI